MTILCLALRQHLHSRRIPGEQWPAAAVLDSLRPFTKPVVTKRAEIASLGYDDLAAYDPFDRLASVPDEPEPAGPVQAVVAASAGPAISVSAILIAGDDRVAVINNTLVRIGSTLPGGSRVIAIERDHVEIVRPSGTKTVFRMNQGG